MYHTKSSNENSVKSYKILPKVIFSIIGILSIISGIGLKFWKHPHRKMIIERDATLSLPYTNNFPLYSIYLLSFLPPLVISAIFQRKVKYLIHIFSFLSIASFITSVIQIYLAIPRPSFFAICNYKGYRIALESENFTSYLINTIPGVPGVIDFCSGSQEDIDMSLRSFPCQYTTLITLSTLLISYYLWDNPRLIDKNNTLLNERPMLIIFRLICGIFWFITMLVPLARLHVNANFPSDIIGGWVISGLIFISYKSIFGKKEKKIKQDNYLLNYYST